MKRIPVFGPPRSGKTTLSEKREDLADGCENNVDLAFLKWIRNFKKRQRAEILSKLSEKTGELQVFTLKKHKSEQRISVNKIVKFKKFNLLNCTQQAPGR